MDNKINYETVDMHSEETERCHSLGFQPACKQSRGAGHAYIATLEISMPPEVWI